MSKLNKSRVWLITGTSSGLGRAIAEAALSNRDRVIATARNVQDIRALYAQYPENVLTIRLDVTDATSIRDAVAAGLEAFGRIDVLVNNAGIGIEGAVEEINDEQVRKLFETNVFGTLNVIRAVLPTMRKQRSGHIINMSSLAGRMPFPALGIYTGTKFALAGLSESLATEVAPLGIAVTIVEPGAFATDFMARSMQYAPPMIEYGWIRDQLKTLTATAEYGQAFIAAHVLLRLVNLERPPLRLALGPNAQPILLAKLQADIEEYKRFEELWRQSTIKANAIA